MAIIDRKREMEYTQKLKENELVVYTATPEQINKMLKGGNNMGRPKGSKNKLTMLQVEEEINAPKTAVVDIIMEEAEAIQIKEKAEDIEPVGQPEEQSEDALDYINDFRIKLIDKMRHAALEAYLQEVSEHITEIDESNMKERAEKIIDACYGLIIETAERGL